MMVVLKRIVRVEAKVTKNCNNNSSSSHYVESMVVEVAQRVYSGRKGYEVDALPFEVVIPQFSHGDSWDDGAASPETLPSTFRTYWCVHWVSRNYVSVE